MMLQCQTAQDILLYQLQQAKLLWTSMITTWVKCSIVFIDTEPAKRNHFKNDCTHNDTTPFRSLRLFRSALQKVLSPKGSERLRVGRS